MTPGRRFDTSPNILPLTRPVFSHMQVRATGMIQTCWLLAIMAWASSRVKYKWRCGPFSLHHWSCRTIWLLSDPSSRRSFKIGSSIGVIFLTIKRTIRAEANEAKDSATASRWALSSIVWNFPLQCFQNNKTFIVIFSLSCVCAAAAAAVNRAIIEINQDPLGVQGLRIHYDKKIEVIVFHFCHILLRYEYILFLLLFWLFVLPIDCVRYPLWMGANPSGSSTCFAFEKNQHLFMVFDGFKFVEQLLCSIDSMNFGFVTLIPGDNCHAVVLPFVLQA